MKLDGLLLLQRVCDGCVTAVQTTAVLTHRVIELSEQLQARTKVANCTAKRPSTLEEAVGSCEASMALLESVNGDAHVASGNGEIRSNEELKEARKAQEAAEARAKELEEKLDIERNRRPAHKTTAEVATSTDPNKKVEEASSEACKENDVCEAVISIAAEARDEKKEEKLEIEKKRQFVLKTLPEVATSTDPKKEVEEASSETCKEDDVCEAVTAIATEANCAVCSSALGKRKLNPRHLCRLCSRTVCGKCSTSMVKMEGESALQRACDPCVAGASEAPVLRERLAKVQDEAARLREALVTSGFTKDCIPEKEEFEEDSDEDAGMNYAGVKSEHPLRCAEGHELTPKKCTGTGMFVKRCNMCKKRLKKGMHRYSCKPCTYHLCEGCAARAPDQALDSE